MSKLFGTDGIRGIVGTWPMVPEFFLKLGQAVGSVLQKEGTEPTLIVGRDTRESGIVFQNALVSGLTALGVHVIDAEVITTPGVAFLVRKFGSRAGAVISASHNPVDQNGIKFFNHEGHKLGAELEEQIEALIQSGPPEMLRGVERGGRLGTCVDARPYQELYVQSLLEEHPPRFLDGLSFVVDCANGAASHLAPEVFAQAGARVVTFNASPTGVNINVEAGSEFVRRNPTRMAELIRHFRVDFGVAFDGDADRVVFVDSTGNLIDGDHMLGILSLYLDRRDQLLGRAVVTTTMRNGGLKAHVESAGLQMYETPVGDKYVVERLRAMQRENPANGKIGLGGEQAGHIVLIDDEHTTGDGIRTALFLMHAFLDSGVGSIEALAGEVGKTPQIIASAFVGFGDRYDRARLDGLERQTLAGTPGLIRANLRYSGTEPQFRVMLESDGLQSENELAKIAVKISRQVQHAAGVKNGEIDILNCTRGGTLPLTFR